MSKHSEQQAQAQYEYIAELIERIHDAQASDDNKNLESVQHENWENPLSVLVRADWQQLNDVLEITEFQILLCTGGPAVKIEGELDQYHQPESCRLYHQDWFEQWEEWPQDSDQEAILLEYCQQFYFGD